MSVAPHMVKNLGYDPKRDIAPITMGVMFPNVFVVHDAVPAKTLAEFVALAKQKAGQAHLCVVGIGGAGHLAASSSRSAPASTCVTRLTRAAARR
jgi:tripartite-type tricarboxylate transporter receptor subunit TctC